MSTSPYQHIEETWGLDGNPFPHSAISGGWTDPYSSDVFPDEEAEFFQKTVRGALQGNRQVGFLWSKGPGGDTGYGKTALMRESVRKINADFGRQVEAITGMRDERIVPIAAGFSELNTMNRTGLYPVLFNAVVGMAKDANAPLLRSRELICTEIGDDAPAKVAAKLTETRLAIAPTSPALRPDLLKAFAEAPDEVPAFLGRVSSATQIRTGLHYLDFAMIALAAAGVSKVFLMIDQLEDLATNGSLSAARRGREIGRIRDLLENEPYASMLHVTFTFHATAAGKLERFWEQNRLPSFEDTPSNQAAVVVLRGVRDDDQVEALLCVPGSTDTAWTPRPLESWSRSSAMLSLFCAWSRRVAPVSCSTGRTNSSRRGQKHRKGSSTEHSHENILRASVTAQRRH